MATPEARARQLIDELLIACGWVVQDFADLNLGAGRGVAVREFGMKDGAADYLLFVDRVAVGTVEAKKLGFPLVGVEEQSAKYSVGLPTWVRRARLPLPFAYETTGVETRFTSQLDPEPRSRLVFAFHRPEMLADWLRLAPAGPAGGANDTLRARLRRLPPLPAAGLRDCQVQAITNLERSLAADRPRALIQMATGSGKTFTAVGAVYRLLKYGGARRVLFLVDRANLGRQALREFQDFATPDDGRKFAELYGVQHLRSNALDPAASVCITTIQRLYSMLRGEADFDPANEEGSLSELDAALAVERPKEVAYNPALPIETFDVIVADECHRSIYGLWRGVLEYFDAYLIGLTATPNKQTFGFFQTNLVMEYGYARAVADGVNVDHRIYRIRTAIGEGGGRIERHYVVGRRDRATRRRRWERLDDDLVYAAKDLDRAVVVPDQIRTVIRAFKDALFADLFPGRTEVPKTLIFAKDDAHADDIVQIVREEFGRGNDFAKKITYRTTGEKPEELIRAFRNSPLPRVAVTVDMIATGTDIKPLEVLLFLRSVRSRGLFEQMKGRGTRTIADSDFQAVTPDAATKTHFVLVDAVGVCDDLKTDSQPLERKRTVAFDKLLQAVAVGARDEATLASLAGRLGRLAPRLTAGEAAAVAAAAGGQDLRALAAGLVAATDPDEQLAAAQRATGLAEPDRVALRAAAAVLADAATAPFDSPALRKLLVAAQQRDEQTIDEVSIDRVTAAGWDGDDAAARRDAEGFAAFIAANRDEIAALQLLYARPRRAPLRLEDVEGLAAALAAPPLGLTTDRLWLAYAALDRARVRGAGLRRLTTDLVALVRYATVRERDVTAVLEPHAEAIGRRFDAWLTEQEARRGKPFAPDQRAWLDLIRDHLAASLTIEAGDFDYQPFAGGAAGAVRGSSSATSCRRCWPT